MKDFTLKSYREYLKALQERIGNFVTFRELISMATLPEKFVLVRHDVDRKPGNALKMAQLENEMGIKSTYYFRYKPETYKPDIIKAVAALGHEVGYHYENLSDMDGNVDLALVDFEKKLNAFREIVKIDTISMHGRPLKKFDNRDLWKVSGNHQLLTGKFRLLGEVYLDIDYKDIAYINDTGRNWTSTQSNLRDKVDSRIAADFNNGEDLLQYLKDKPHARICFQIHPERWTDSTIEWTLQLLKDQAINSAKAIVSTTFKK